MLNAELEMRPADEVMDFRSGTESIPIGGHNMVQGYCVKCKAKREMQDAKKVTLKNGKPATKGTCPKCGTKMFRIGG